MRSLIFTAVLLATPALAANADAGKYQAVLGDCAGCHGKNLAGGVELQTPFGKMVTPNITPDRDTGIGNYSADDFRKAMKTGMAPGGKRLYPAMPYPYYAKMTDSDVDALFGYLRTVKPVSNAVTVNQLRFPFNLRILMAGWNALFFKPAPPVAQRGDYLVNGPAHCGACHAAKNLLGADKGGLTGGLLQGWYAPNLTGDTTAGLGKWSKAELVEYLKIGRNAHSLASGPMAEAVENSTAQMTDADLGAIATYIKALAPSGGSGGGVDKADMQMQAGLRVYRMNCVACHGWDGKGSAVFPPLAGNTNVTQSSAETSARMVVVGGKGASTRGAPTGQAMPSFAWKLGDAEVANVLTYIRNTWGNAAPAVDAGLVERIRSEKR